jgi:GNAT superfamily N-acetyltransferase
MEWTREPFTLSDDATRLDFDYVEASLRTTYWAADRPRAVMEAAFRNALGFGLYDTAGGDGAWRQVGFARVVTDKVNFAWIADVFIDPALRGRGLGKWMIQRILEHPHVKDTRQALGTQDAHAFYEQLGFVRREILRRYPGDAQPPAY